MSLVPRFGWGPLIFFANPGYRGTWMSGAIVSAVRWLEVLAVSVFVFQVTASPFAVSMVMLSRAIPNALLGGLMGSLAAVFRRETLIAIGFIGIGLTRLTLGCLVLFDAIAIWHVLLGMFLSGILDAAEFPIRSSLAGDYVPPDQVSRALAFDQFSNVFMMATGPIVGGVLLDEIGLHGAYFVGAALNVLGIVVALRLPPPTTVRAPARVRILAGLCDGFRYIRSQRFLVGVVVITLIFNTFTWPFTTMIAVFGREELLLSATLIGALMAMLGTGCLIATIILSVAWVPIVNQAYFFGAMMAMLCILLLPAMTTFESALIVMLFIGMGVGFFSSNQGAVMFLNTAPQYRTQAMGILTMAVGVGPLGILQVGLLAAAFGAPTAMIVTASEGLIAMAIAFFVWPEFRRSPSRTPRA